MSAPFWKQRQSPSLRERRLFAMSVDIEFGTENKRPPVSRGGKPIGDGFMQRCYVAADTREEAEQKVRSCFHKDGYRQIDICDCVAMEDGSMRPMVDWSIPPNEIIRAIDTGELVRGFSLPYAKIPPKPRIRFVG